MEKSMSVAVCRRGWINNVTRTRFLEYNVTCIVVQPWAREEKKGLT